LTFHQEFESPEFLRISLTIQNQNVLAMQATIDQRKLFWASCLALLITSVFFWISPNTLNQNKTTKLNHFHLWFRGGVAIGTLLIYLYNKARIGSIGVIPIILIVAFRNGSVYPRKK
jgi:hypothetical protein